jgi:hypothetical protein
MAIKGCISSIMHLRVVVKSDLRKVAFFTTRLARFAPVYFFMLNPMRPRSGSTLMTLTSTTSPTETTSRGFFT